jgi:hypothetical protein
MTDEFFRLWTYFTSAVILGLLPVVIMSALTAAAMSVSGDLRKNRTIASAFTAFGSVVGILAGASREAVIGEALPLIIPIVTVYITYLNDRKPAGHKDSGYLYALLGFFIGTAFGAFYGAAYRGTGG